MMSGAGDNVLFHPPDDFKTLIFYDMPQFLALFPGPHHYDIHLYHACQRAHRVNSPAVSRASMFHQRDVITIPCKCAGILHSNALGVAGTRTPLFDEACWRGDIALQCFRTEIMAGNEHLYLQPMSI